MRFPKLTIFLTQIVLATVASACEDARITLDMRDAIYSNDIRGVERLFGTHQGAFEAGELTAEEMRCLMRHFVRSRPETVSFIEDWRAAYPESVFAMTAKALNLWQASWDMRGENHPRQTYPEALRTFKKWQSEGWSYASRAYQTNPRLIPAADYLISSANAMSAQARGLQVFREVMERDPNFGTYRRARGMHMPGWGHSWRKAQQFCERYAEDFEQEEQAPVLIISQAYGDRYDWRIATLKTLDRPDLDHLWMWYLTREGASAHEAARARDVLSDERYINERIAERFDGNLAEKYGHEPFRFAVFERRVGFARKELPHDPYNPKLIGWATETITIPSVADDSTEDWVQFPEVAPSELVEFARRLLVRQPYNTDSWSDYTYALLREQQVIPHDLHVALLINQIVYSNHRIDVVNGYLGHLVGAFRDWTMYSGERPVPEQHKSAAHLLSVYYDGVDLDRDILCPFVRAMRLHDLICETAQGSHCELPGYVTGSFAAIEYQAKERGICTTEKLMPRSALYFSPVPLPDHD